jgi:HTH-type transcriptional regulator/antitoxin HipB
MRVNTPRDVAAAVRGRRIGLGMSQADLARRAGVSRPWVSQVEAGKPTAQLSMVIRLLEALDLQIEIAEPGSEAADETASVDLDELLEEYRRR